MDEWCRKNYIDVTIDLVKGTKYERYLYLPLDDLLVIKTEYDKRAIVYHQTTMEDYRNYFGSSVYKIVNEDRNLYRSVMYEESLRNSMVIALVMQHKNSNLQASYRYGQEILSQFYWEERERIKKHKRKVY